jgi:predicted enzyme related to lactoylglutathione lyase
MHIEVISIPVSDQENAINFYERLGFQKVRDAPFGEGMRWVELSIGGETNITLVNWFPEMPAGSIHGLILNVEDIRKKWQEIRDQDIDIDSIFNTPWGKFANFKDPDGNGWSLRE